jgi:hypothetical protein
MPVCWLPLTLCPATGGPPIRWRGCCRLGSKGGIRASGGQQALQLAVLVTSGAAGPSQSIDQLLAEPEIRPLRAAPTQASNRAVPGDDEGLDLAAVRRQLQRQRRTRRPMAYEAPMGMLTIRGSGYIGGVVILAKAAVPE